MVVDGEHARCPPRAAAAPSQIVERPQYEPTSSSGHPGRRRRPGGPPSYSASPSSGGMNPLAASAAARRAGSTYQVSQWMMVSGSGRTAGLKSVPLV